MNGNAVWGQLASSSRYGCISISLPTFQDMKNNWWCPSEKACSTRYAMLHWNTFAAKFEINSRYVVRNSYLTKSHSCNDVSAKPVRSNWMELANSLGQRSDIFDQLVVDECWSQPISNKQSLLRHHQLFQNVYTVDVPREHQSHGSNVGGQVAPRNAHHHLSRHVYLCRIANYFSIFQHKDKQEGKTCNWKSCM